MPIRDHLVLFASPHMARGVFESHVINFIQALRKTAELRILLICYGIPNADLEQRKLVALRLAYLKNKAGVEDFLILTDRNPLHLRNHIQSVNGFVDKFPEKRTILFCQNYYAAFIGSFIKKRRPHLHLHVDLKGIVPEETLYYAESAFYRRLAGYVMLKSMESAFIKRADSLSVVSHHFAKYIQNRHHFKRSIHVFPSVIDRNIFYSNETVRIQYRQNLNLTSTDQLITYCGSFQNWQNPEALFRFFKFCKTHMKTARFLIITHDLQKAHELAQRHNVASLTKIVKSTPVEVNGYLNASDFCVILRRRDLVNRIASPTKLAEYIATQNRIVMTDEIGDFSETLRNTDFTQILDSLDLQTLENASKNLEKLQIPTHEQINQLLEPYSLDKRIVVFRELFNRSETSL